MKIGGRAYRNGVRLVGENYSVKAYYSNGELRYTISKKTNSMSKLFKILRKIPVLRGIISLFYALLSFFKEAGRNPRKFWFISLILFADIIISYLIWILPAEALEAITIYHYIIAGIIIAFILRATLLKEIFKFHGAEHKAVNYFEDNYKTPLKEQSRLASRCGTNLIVFYLIIITAFSFIDIEINGLLIEVLALGIAYEIILLAPDYILSIAYIAQRFTTIEPDDKHLKAAETALEILIAKENDHNTFIV